MSSQSIPEKKNKSLLKSSAVVSTMTMMSRILGLVRDILFARFIGSGGSAEAFFVAFKIPNFLRRLFAEGAFSQAFVPVLSEYREQGSIVAVRNFIDRVAGCLGLTLIALTTIVVLASPVFTALFGLGFALNNPEKFWLTSDLLRITFPYLLLISLTGFAGAILNSYDRFAVPALTPVLLNVCLIIAAAFVSPLLEEPVYALAWAVMIAGVVQFTFQLPFLMRLGLMPHPKVDWSDEAVRKVLKLMAPAMFGVSVSQINLLLDTVLATFLHDGSVGWLYYSDRLTELPLGVFGVGIATVILPSLSREYARGEKQFSPMLDWALKLIFLIGVPAATALVIIAEPVLFTLFQYDKTTTDDIAMSTLSLRAYALGLLAFMLIKVLASSYFSRQDMKTPVRIGIIAMLSNMGLNLLFVLPLYFFWSIGHVGLAAATSCSAFLNAGLLYRGLRRQGVYQPSGWGKFLLQLLFATLCMASILVAVLFWYNEYHDATWLARSANLFLLTTAGILAYLLGLLIAGIRLHHIVYRP